MAAFVIYVIKWAVALTLLYSLYGLFLRRETFHSLNRVVLVGILLVSLVLPCFHLTTRHASPLNRGVERLESLVTDTPTPDLSREGREVYTTSPENIETPPLPSGERSGVGLEGLSALSIVIFAYLAGAAALLLIYIISLVRFMLLLRRAERVECPQAPHWVRVVVSSEVPNSCSWLRWVVLTPADKVPSQAEVGEAAILRHECAHLRCGHSWDKILCELTCRLLWFLPFAWMLRQDLADVHEFEADRAVLRSGADKIEYNMLIIKKAARAGLQPVTNAFNESKTKKRMIMMFKKKSTRRSALKALYVLPLAAFTVMAFAKPEAMEEIEEQVKRSLPPIPTQREDISVADAVAEMSSAEPKTPVADTVQYAAALEEIREEFSPELLLDSTMTAIGAQKIGEGVYVGRFEPNFSSDTIRVATVWLDDEQSEHTHEYRFREAAEGTYNIDLQWEDREHLGRGWHIRWMKPAVEADAQRQQYHRQPVAYDHPLFMIPGEVPNAEKLPTSQGWLEQTDSETHFVMPVPAKIVKLGNFTLHTRYACLLDPDTGDKYMCRGVRIYTGKGDVLAQDVSLETEVDDDRLLMATFVFPPLDKKVNRIALYDYETSEMSEFYNVKDITRKPMKIIP